MQRRTNWLLLALVSLFLGTSCDSKAVFDEYKSVPNQWHKDSIATFYFKAPDTTNNYNLYVNLRNNNDYAYSNLFLIVELNYPNGKAITDTLEYKMAAKNGELLGSGFTDIKENKLWYRGYKSPFKFTENGDYSVNIQHAMRKNGEVNGVENLEGITDIGFRVESAQN
ncbi:MAG: gliding motility lipoprotein GldH [Winogradskyella sp.]|uniref:Gliding motility lipoprotein GldH n=1 Tax=Winogradskyella poriferorum TaxID=307627 RepID=A0ABU7W2V6_9FLAO|nr:gliding motility lipoprotein GldH [Winogradskyella sp.]|tara:strand:- start:945 stop:1448 length:504 start_codon:yes stop_codon:yes gene_type:complete